MSANEVVQRATDGIIALLEADDGPMSYARREDGTTIMCLDGDFDIEEFARAAIAAMREPTEAMVESGASAIRGPHKIFGGPGVLAWARDAWRTMIDEALKP